ncbi:hypothetical protein VTN49DRAFT_2696 [Thermomyces lanuginosus]|uniref:uncharacterized protein n=1 Tax=Thermomyces lanuginosus TaxID=5541 RepID=UPI0037437DBD
MSGASPKPRIDANPALQRYYGSLESRIGYRVFLGGTRHFGYYEPGTLWPFPIGAALRRMEEYLYNSLGLKPGSLVLDAGCGAGFVAIYLARKGLRVRGIDIISRHVKWARDNVKKAGLEHAISIDKMDYHHLETLTPETFDGVYTMETFVHARDPAQALREFFRVLKPGGSITLHEYEHKRINDAPERVARSFHVINKFAALPTNELSEYGTLQTLLEEAGFVDVQVSNLSENVRPMMRLFYLCAIIPYIFITLFGLEKYFINAVAAVGVYRNTDFYSYVSISAKKPSQQDSAATQEKSLLGS